jgi:hypothetical protein
MADLDNSQFTAAYALGFLVSTSRRNSCQKWLCLYNVSIIRFLATDL